MSDFSHGALHHVAQEMVHDRHFHVRILDQFPGQTKYAQSDNKVGQPYFFIN